MVSAQNIIIGTRKSELALAQSSEVQNLLLNHLNQNQDNSCNIQIKGFKTTGDKILHKSLSDIGGKGLFTKEIEEALISHKISLAVHSMKDMPAIQPRNLNNLIVLKREDPRDAFISLKYKSIKDLPQNSIVGTSSTRRKALILAIRPDLKIVDFRGNINTRLEKIKRNEVDATILAVAGLKRINKQDYISSIIPTSKMLPAVGQGAIVVQCREDDKFSCDLIRKINHEKTAICIETERAFLREINGSCKTPVAGYCEIKDNSLFFRALICSPNGDQIYKTQRISDFKDANKIGKDAGKEIKKNAQHILKYYSSSWDC